MEDPQINDKYEPVESNYYSFRGLTHLYQTFEEYLGTHHNVILEKVNLCAYHVVNDGKYPFLQFLLLNDFNQLSFISLENSKYIDNSKLPDLCKNYLSNCLNLTHNISHNENNIDENIDYNGFYISNNEMFIFFDITKYKLVLNDIYRENMLWFALTDEIINTRTLSGIPIDNDVTNFFTLNSQFSFLYNKNLEKYEVPSVAYITASENKTKFTYVFGVSSSDAQSIFGPYYYFTNYDNCLKKIKTNDNTNNESKKGIIRFALFLENTKIVENLLTDENDESEIKKDKFKDETTDKNYERLTIRISDHDGKWTENYESIFLTNIRLDDGTLMKDTPIICVKTYEQQYPLSYHFVGVKRVSNMYYSSSIM